MGSSLSEPVIEKNGENGEWQGLKYGSCLMQGWSKHMEDRCAIECPITHEPLQRYAYFAVFDGHGGEGVSSFCLKSMLQYIVDCHETQLTTVESSVTAVLGARQVPDDEDKVLSISTS